MIPAEQWDLGPASPTPELVQIIRRVQADALRFAADISGPIHRAYLHNRADELDPPAPKTQSCPTCSKR